MVSQEHQDQEETKGQGAEVVQDAQYRKMLDYHKEVEKIDKKMGKEKQKTDQKRKYRVKIGIKHADYEAWKR